MEDAAALLEKMRFILRLAALVLHGFELALQMVSLCVEQMSCSVQLLRVPQVGTEHGLEPVGDAVQLTPLRTSRLEGCFAIPQNDLHSATFVGLRLMLASSL